MQALDLDYFLLFLFNNIINYSVYRQDTLQINYIDKDFDKKQAFLRNR